MEYWQVQVGTLTCRIPTLTWIGVVNFSQLQSDRNRSLQHLVWKEMLDSSTKQMICISLDLTLTKFAAEIGISRHSCRSSHNFQLILLPVANLKYYLSALAAVIFIIQSMHCSRIENKNSWNLWDLKKTGKTSFRQKRCIIWLICRALCKAWQPFGFLNRQDIKRWMMMIGFKFCDWKFNFPLCNVAKIRKFA